MTASRGVSLMELLMVVAAAAILFAGSASAVLRAGTQAEELEAYTQAVLTAKQVLELRRVKGRFPATDELVRLRSAIGTARAPSVLVREEPFREPGLAQVTVTVSWRSEGAGSRRQVKLVSLARTPR